MWPKKLGYLIIALALPYFLFFHSQSVAAAYAFIISCLKIAAVALGITAVVKSRRSGSAFLLSAKQNFQKTSPFVLFGLS